MTYALIAGLPGQVVATTVFQPEFDTDYLAASPINAGQLVELTASGATASPFGLCIQTVAAGAPVTVLRKGRAFVSWSGSTTAAFNTVPNIAHAATSTAAGSEVSAGPVAGLRLLRNTSGTAGFTGVVLCDVNLP